MRYPSEAARAGAVHDHDVTRQKSEGGAESWVTSETRAHREDRLRWRQPFTPEHLLNPAAATSLDRYQDCEDDSDEAERRDSGCNSVDRNRDVARAQSRDYDYQQSNGDHE